MQKTLDKFPECAILIIVGNNVNPEPFRQVVVGKVT
jgi:hypothetical protein